jgi:hypothetical protein
VAQLLWKEEAIEELKARGLQRGLSKKARHYAWVTLSQAVGINELRAITRQRMLSRKTWNW